MLAIDESALKREVHETGCDAVLPDRNLAQNERLGASGLEQRQNLAHARVESVDLVQEQHVRDAADLELLEDEMQRRVELRIRLANNNYSVTGRQYLRAI